MKGMPWHCKLSQPLQCRFVSASMLWSMRVIYNNLLAVVSTNSLQHASLGIIMGLGDELNRLFMSPLGKTL